MGGGWWGEGVTGGYGVRGIQYNDDNFLGFMHRFTLIL